MINYKELKKTIEDDKEKLTDFEKIIQIYREAEKGIPDAQNVLGLMYYYGEGLERSEGEAIRWWTEAAKQGHAEAQCWVGVIYYISWVRRDFKKSMEWLMKSAKQCNGNASYWIGNLYRRGNGTGINRIEAMKWYKKAHGEGNEAAMAAIREMNGEDND